MDIIVSRLNKVGDLIKHIITTYTMTSSLSQDFPLDDPDSSAYELRLLDDEGGGCFTPLYEIASLDASKRIGEFGVDAVALCKSKEKHAKKAPIEEESSIKLN